MTPRRQWSLRCATRDDLPAVVELWNTEAGPTRHAGGLPEATALVERDPQALIVAEIHGVLVGAVIAAWDGWRFHVYRLAVVSGQRRKGVATALVSGAIERARAVGAVRVDAMVNGENRVAQHFWRNSGFECDTADERWSLEL